MKDNPVAKHAHKFNKSAVHKDRKKAEKRGDRKHKGQYKETNEDLRKWFGKGKKGDWVRVGTDGEIKGDCAREPGEGKPKCMPRDKAHSMSKKDRGSAARRKRAKDPTVDRPGTGNKPIMVKTDKKESTQENAALDKLKSIKSRGGSTIPKPKGSAAGGRKSAANFRAKAKAKYDAKAGKGALDKKISGYKKRSYNEDLEEKNEPTNPKLWAKFKAQAKSKFDVYPSAYANGWAAKQYKAAGEDGRL